MGALNLIPLLVLFAVVGGVGWVCYQMFLYFSELADRGMHKLEQKNVVFTKDGAKVSVQHVSAEDYADRTQKALVNTWSAAQEGIPALNTRIKSRSR